MTCKGQNFRFNHKADVYYAEDVYNEWNEFEKVWVLGHKGALCELASDKFNSDTRYAIQNKLQLFDMPLLVFGRFKDDIRTKDGVTHSLTDIMVTNVRSYCEDTPIFIESADNNAVTDFEIGSFQPFTNPWGKIEYYKVQAIRMDDQRQL